MSTCCYECVLQIKTVSEANRRDKPSKRTARTGKTYHVAGYIVKAQRAAQQRKDAFNTCRAEFGLCTLSVHDRVLIELTRCAARKLDDDNLRSAFKAVRDGIADYLQIDDGSTRLTWSYAQEFKSKANEIKLRITING